jgi:hypothetical protein
MRIGIWTVNGPKLCGSVGPSLLARSGTVGVALADALADCAKAGNSTLALAGGGGTHGVRLARCDAEHTAKAVWVFELISQRQRPGTDAHAAAIRCSTVGAAAQFRWPRLST